MARKSSRSEKNIGIDINTLPAELRNKMLENTREWRNDSLSIVVDAAKKYEVELERDDKLHRARLSTCKTNFIAAIRQAVEAHDTSVFTEWDVAMAKMDIEDI